ncbi:hypothetical protein MPSEU_000101100 [Mayamaea pseudoterrestris]|nr:hypothetical protein MPSEU_000101100 [Mayamaea pseudoterrestris]
MKSTDNTETLTREEGARPQEAALLQAETTASLHVSCASAASKPLNEASAAGHVHPQPPVDLSNSVRVHGPAHAASQSTIPAEQCSTPSTSSNTITSPAAMGAQAAAAVLHQYFAQQTRNLPAAEAGTMQHTLWQLQQAMQQPQQQHYLQRIFAQSQPLPPPQQSVQAAAAPSVPLRPATAVSQLLPTLNPHQQQQQQQTIQFPPSTVSLGSSSIPSTIPGAVIMNNANTRKRKPEENNSNNFLQFSDAASKSLKLDHSRSVVSSSSVNSLGDIGPPKEKTDAELARMTPVERRRYDRNLREQQRSYRISQQIKTLRDVLSEGGVPFKPNKFSILVSVTDYIKNLQQRSIMLDSEHKKLADTIRRTIELVASGQVPLSSEDDRSSVVDKGEASDDLDRDVLFVQGLDYKSVFEYCPCASGVASLDGRILYSNHGLEQYFGATCIDMEQQSLFLYIRNHQDVFEAMADILRRSSVASEAGEPPLGRQQPSSHELLFWCGQVTSHKNLQVAI